MIRLHTWPMGPPDAVRVFGAQGDTLGLVVSHAWNFRLGRWSLSLNVYSWHFDPHTLNVSSRANSFFFSCDGQLVLRSPYFIDK